MSHYYYLKCEGCGEISERYNHAKESFITAAKTAKVAYDASRSGWDVSLPGLGTESVSIGDFVAKHYNHGGFMVVSEYWAKDDPRRESEYPPTKVIPTDPDYPKVVLSNLLSQAKAISIRIAYWIKQMEALKDE